jgi:N utilization substance protein B
VSQEKTKRRLAREAAMRILYAREFDSAGGDAEGTLSALVGEETRGFARDLVDGIERVRGTLDRLLSARLTGWDLAGLGKLEATVLRLGAYELLYREEIPRKVVINEAVDIAKEYAGPKAGSLVNGVLDALSKGIDKGGREEEGG